MEQAGAEAGAVRQGYLRRLKTMKRKYFVLRGERAESSARLEYYDSEKKFRARAPPKRAIPLKSCFNINRRLDTKHKHVIALYTKEESFCVVLDCEEELRAWLNALLLLHHGDDGSDELLHPSQHVWLVNVQKKGLGASKNILGLYHLCLTDKTISLVKIKSNNNVLYDSCIREYLEFSLKNIRRCGDSECFFYMELGRLTVIGAGELWMHTDDANIAQSMHSTILRAMQNCDREHAAQRDRAMSTNDAYKPYLLNRRQTISDVKTLSQSNEKKLCSGGICMGSCIKPCGTSSASYCVDEPAKPPAPNSPIQVSNKEPSNNTSLIYPTGDTASEHDSPQTNTLVRPKWQQSPEAFAKSRVIKHLRTVSLPTGCALFLPSEKETMPKVCHERTRSLPLAGDETQVPIDKSTKHHSSSVVNGDIQSKRQPAQSWLIRRASTGSGYRGLPKWSPGHPKNGTTGVRNRCVSMPSRACPRSDVDADKTPQRVSSEHLEDVGEVVGADEVDSIEWTPAPHRTPRIPEEPDVSPYCDMNMSTPKETSRRITGRLNSTHHSRNSSLAEDASPPEGYLLMTPGVGDAGYVDMHTSRHPPDRSASPAASNGSVASGTPSTDLRFSEYHLDPVTSRILMSEDDDGRPIPRAYSVGSRPETGRTAPVRTPLGDTARTRAFSVGSRTKVRPLGHVPPPPHFASPSSTKTSSAPLLAPRSSADTLCDDLMELDFSNNHSSSSPRTKPPVTMAHTPPTTGFVTPIRPTKTPISSVFNRVARTSESKVDEYVDISPTTAITAPRTSGYVEMRPSDRGLTATTTSPAAVVPVSATLSPSVSVSIARSPPTTVGSIARSPPVDGYMEMNYTKKAETNRTPSRPILILSDSAHPLASSYLARATTTDPERFTPPKSTPIMSPQTPNRGTFPTNSRSSKKMGNRQRRNSKDAVTPISAQTIFPFTLESPASPARPFADGEKNELESLDAFDDEAHYAEVSVSGLSTVREISEEGPKTSPDAKVTALPHDYVILKPSATADTVRTTSRPIAARLKLGSEADNGENEALLSSNPLATKTLARLTAGKLPGDTKPALIRATSGSGGPARFTPIDNQLDSDEPGSRKSTSPKPVDSALNRALRCVCADEDAQPLIYASLDLEARPNIGAGAAPSTYTQIDFVRSEKLNTVDSN